MNAVIECIKERRSVRAYESRGISRDKLAAIIEAGNWATTGGNFQPWRFVVIEDASLRQRLHDVALPMYRKWYENASGPMKAMRDPVDAVVEDPVYYSAPVIVFVIGTGMGTRANDCPIVCQNIMLAARSLGIGSCWVGFGKMALGDEQVSEALEIQEDEEVYGPILLGYPEGGFPQPPAKKEPVVKWI